MDILEFKDLEDWRLKNECHPFEDSLGNLCITVESEYESFGGEKETRLNEAKEYGIDRLIRFYGKTYADVSISTSIDATQQQLDLTTSVPTELYSAAEAADYFISLRTCARMKVLIKIPKITFDKYTVSTIICDINKPEEGYLSAYISVENFERDIDYITTSMEDFLPKMALADKYITNINIVEEIKRLRQVKSVIRRYFNLNSVVPTVFAEEPCESDKQSQMEIGFSSDYKPAFALIDGNKHTIGYDCFLEASLLSHPTTANYLTQLGGMSSALTNQLSLDFDIFQFLSKHTYPTPVIGAKEGMLDGLKKYDANGNLFSFANLAKLINLKLDRECKEDPNLIKDDEEEEKRILLDEKTRREIAETVKQSKEFVGNMKLSSEGVEDLKETWGSMKDAKEDSKQAFRDVWTEVMDRINWGCVLEESLKCMLEAAITRFGTEVFDDPDLSDFFNADGFVESYGFCGDDEEDCDKEFKLKVGLPVFQGVNIPANFPTTDYVAKTIDAALKELYEILINSIISLIMWFIELLCKLISSLPDAPVMDGLNFTELLSKTLGIDITKLGDLDTWTSAIMSSGGTGFLGVVGNLSSNLVGSWDALVSDTGIALNMPNPSTGTIEEVFISPEVLSRTASGIKMATEDLGVVLTSSELGSLYKGNAPSDVLDLAYSCLSRGDSELFQSRENVSDLFSSLGGMVKSSMLEPPVSNTPPVTNACQLGDGSVQDMLRKNFLTTKDPLLSDEEVEEILSKEKNKTIEEIHRIHKYLMSLKDGSFLLSFPSLFGTDDSLIPEPPPIIADAMKWAAGGMYAASMTNLDSVLTMYPDIWETIKNNKIEETSINLGDIYENASTSFSVENEGDTITMGYKLSTPPETVAADDYTMEEPYFWDYGWDVDLQSYTDENKAAGNESSDGTPFEEMLGIMGLEELDYKDREEIFKSLKEDIRNVLEDFGIDADANSFLGDNLGWADLSDYEGIDDIIKKEVDNIFSQLGVTMEDWMSYDASCQEQIWGSVGEITNTDGNEIKYVWRFWKDDEDDVKLGVELFNNLIGIYALGEYWYMQGKKALVVMDMANFLEEWDDENGSDFADMKGGNEYDKWDGDSRPSAELIDGSYENPIGQVTLSYDINDVISEQKKKDIADLVSEGALDQSEVTALITFRTDFGGVWSVANRTVTLSFKITPKGEEEFLVAERKDDWTETLTIFERKGARLKSTSDGVVQTEDDTNLHDEYQHGAGSLANLHDAVLNGGNDSYDIVSTNKIITNIGNYKIGNDLTLSLGRKEAKSNLLEDKYSFTTDNVRYTLLDWFTTDGPMSDSATSAAAGRYGELAIAGGGLGEENENYIMDYKVRIKDLLDNMRNRVLESQYYIATSTTSEVEAAAHAFTAAAIEAATDYGAATTAALAAAAATYAAAAAFEAPENIDSIRDMMNNYMKSDAIKYEDLTQWAEEHVMQVTNTQQLDEMCDTLTPNERTAVSMGVRLLVREFILENALISLQVFDTFNTGFMECEAFRKAIFENIQTEMKKYNSAFSDTLSGNIFSDIKDSAVKYYEYRNLLGDDVEVSSGKSTLLSIIEEEISEIRESIVSSLQLSETGTWDDFVLDKLIPATNLEVSQGYDADNGNYYVEIKTDYVYIIIDDGASEYTTPVPESFILFSSQCEGTVEDSSDVCEDIQQILDANKIATVRQQLFDNEEYKEFINHIFPFRELVTQLSVYQASALSDVAVFNGTYAGRNLFDIFAETKLSTLQVLLAAIYGAGEFTYIDPFLEKLKT
jgi:hypothetical protein